MELEFKELKKEHIKQYNIKEFLFKMVKENYDLDYVPEYHYDIKNLNKYYIEPQKNNFFIVIDKNTDKLIGTSGIRSFDRKNILNREYSEENTASLYRVFVEKEYRHNKIATRLIKKVEEFCKKKQLFRNIPSYTKKQLWCPTILVKSEL